ncbi:peptide chain release factor family protein [Stratiformator vulcanicus]|uniref:Peptide chain release factor 1 n=1 Tax=Stratiformator vulcanicus TaxID=2527980 RepID=A0A517R0G5_9PLAN|nr:peptide chain release factor-like protein [Stratiformator vulcanicus]QDT37323.1 Peptide chain release factor 1 [Stratiformator vulcanicus]
MTSASRSHPPAEPSPRLRPPHPAEASDEELLADCQLKRVRRSGPGGQHRNKVETGVVLRHEPTGTTAEAAERRSVEQNKKVAVRRLRERLALKLRCERNDEGPLPELWTRRIKNRRITISSSHSDLAPLIAIALDFVARYGGDTRVAADRLGITPSQLVRFLKLLPAAFQVANDIREQNGQHRLR